MGLLKLDRAAKPHLGGVFGQIVRAARLLTAGRQIFLWERNK